MANPNIPTTSQLPKPVAQKPQRTRDNKHIANYDRWNGMGKNLHEPTSKDQRAFKTFEEFFEEEKIGMENWKTPELFSYLQFLEYIYEDSRSKGNVNDNDRVNILTFESTIVQKFKEAFTKDLPLPQKGFTQTIKNLLGTEPKKLLLKYQEIKEFIIELNKLTAKRRTSITSRMQDLDLLNKGGKIEEHRYTAEMKRLKKANESLMITQNTTAAIINKLNELEK